MSTVLVKKGSYDYGELKSFIFSVLDRYAGSSIHRKSVVVIKPNFLAPAPPEKAILTHPLVLKTASEYVISKGARPIISDSNAMGTFEKVLRTGGFLRELEGLDVEFREFKKSVAVDVGEPFGKIEIAEDAVRADLLINLPKLKTHSQMLLTLGVKNLFGCIVGLRKPEWHFRAGVDREMFARLLVKIHDAVKPAVTILDGISALEGEGPGRSGIPRQLGIMMGSDSAVALDMTVCRMLGLNPSELLTNRAARALGFDEPIEVVGDLPAITDFRLPLISPLVFGPRRFHGFIRRNLVQRPAVNPEICRACGECWRYCPAQAIHAERTGLKFDYDKCIRCYCCIEVCPHAALRTVETAAGKVFRRLMGNPGESAKRGPERKTN